MSVKNSKQIFSRFWCIALLAILLVNFGNKVTCSRITFQDGRYNDILVAIHRDTDQNLCDSIVQNLQEIFQEANNLLYSATNSRASFGTINILLPYNWGMNTCTFQNPPIGASKIFQTYESSDFKLSLTQPIANSLPWTKQFKGCQSEAETIYFPLKFVLDPSFGVGTKGKLLIHEWTKFRYGVFEEYGFFDDPFYPPCYGRGGSQYYSGCTNTKFNPLSVTEPVVSPDQCRTLINDNREHLRTQLRQATSSLLFSPHFDNVREFCRNEIHNGLAPTKQNVLCERKSVADVIYSHRDFQSGQTDDIFPNDRVPRPSTLPLFNVVRQPRTMHTGFAFIIEDSLNIRQEGRLDHVKQAIAEMIRLAGTGTEVAIFKHNGELDCTNVNNCYFNILQNTADNREVFLSKVPDNSTTIPNSGAQPLNIILQSVIARLATNSVKWNLILVTSVPAVNLESALTVIQNSDLFLSILTYDKTRDWLKFNTIPNTRNVIFLPHCFVNGNICHGKTSSLIADYLLQLVSTEEQPTTVDEVRRYFHKVVDVTVNKTSETFTIPNLVGDGSQTSIYFHFPVYSEGISLQITPPSGSTPCSASTPMLKYNRTLEVRNCPYRSGVWTYTILGQPSEIQPNYNLRGYVTTSNATADINISFDTSHPLENDVFPLLNRFPVYVLLTSKFEEPIISADVEMEIDLEGLQFSSSSKTILLDDGIEPDVVADDGIYSAFLTTFSTTISYHTPQIRVRTNSQSRAIRSLRSDTYEAALLDSNMNSKCCGSKVPYNEVTSIGNTYYTHTVSSFRTGEAVPPGSDFIPPSKIYTPITLVDANQDSITYEFIAPGSNNNVGRVSQYSICCTPSENGNLDDTMCRRVPISLCLPVNAGNVQRCGILGTDILANFFGGVAPEVDTVLYCGFRGINAASNIGPISSFLVDFTVSKDGSIGGGDGGSRTSECNSLDDDCLPIEVFWGLIACIGGLVIIIFVILICWCCCNSKKNKDKKKTEDKRSTYVAQETPRSSVSPDELRNVYINQAYIQDTNGQLKLVASDGELLPATRTTGTDTENPMPPRFVPVPPRRSLSAHELTQADNTNSPANIGNNNNRHVTWINRAKEEDDESLQEDMPVFFSQRPPTFPPKGRTRPQTALPQTPNQPQSPPEFYPVPIPPTRNPTNEQNYGNDPNRRYTSPPHNLWETNGRPPLQNSNFNQNPPVNVATFPSSNQNKTEPPVYASVQRFNRRPPSSLGGFNQPSATRGTGQFSPSYSSASTTFVKPDAKEINYSKHPGRALSEHSGLDKRPEGFSQDYHTRSRPPVRMDHFPSSESEAYSDMSHILPRLAVLMNNPPLTPPIPTYAAPVNLPERPVTSFSPPPVPNYAPSKLPERQTTQFPPTPMTRAPSRENQPKTPELNRPRTFPPPPPPKQFRNSGEEESEDDDSDNWDDDYNEIQFIPPGSSYA